MNGPGGLFALRRPLLVPLLRICLLTWLLFERFDNVARHLRLSIGEHAPSLLHAPHVVSALSAIGAWPVTPGFTDTFATVLVTATIFAIFGIFTRPSLVVVGGCFVVYYGIVSGWGFFNHTPAIGGQLVVALAVVPGTTAYSVDRLLLTWWRRRRDPTLPWRDGIAPRVPFFGELIVLVVVGSLYFASGLSKLRYGGLSWLSGDILRFYLSGAAGSADMWVGPAADTFEISAYTYGASTTAWVRAMSSSTAAMVLLSWLTVITEFGAPLFLLLGGRWRVLWCMSAAGFHIAVRGMMGIGFTMWIWTDLLIAAVAVGEWLAAQSAAARAVTLSAQQATVADALAVGIAETPGAGDVDGVGVVDADARPADDP